jgi:hypothetical protein
MQGVDREGSLRWLFQHIRMEGPIHTSLAVWILLCQTCGLEQTDFAAVRRVLTPGLRLIGVALTESAGKNFSWCTGLSTQRHWTGTRARWMHGLVSRLCSSLVGSKILAAERSEVRQLRRKTTNRSSMWCCPYRCSIRRGASCRYSRQVPLLEVRECLAAVVRCARTLTDVDRHAPSFCSFECPSCGEHLGRQEGEPTFMMRYMAISHVHLSCPSAFGSSAPKMVRRNAV